MTRRGFQVITWVVAVAVSGCAHGGFKAPEDPVEEARLRLDEILSAQGDVVCAARVVEGDWGLRALRGLGSNAPESWTPDTPAGLRWRSYQASQMNLSQASAHRSAALANAKTAETNAYYGVPGAHLMGQYAMYQFDAVHAAITSRPAARRKGSSSVTVAAAQYATVWTEYLSAEDAAEGRDQVLDWLTTRSMANLHELRTYHKDFLRALRKKCD